MHKTGKTRPTASVLLALAMALGAAAGLAGCGGSDEAADSIGSLRLIGDHVIKTRTLFEGVEFGGISGLDRASDGSYWAISDDRGGERGTPRFYSLGIQFDEKAIQGVTIRKMVTLKGRDGQPLPANRRTVDPESIRVAPNGNLYVSSEGNFSSDPASLFQPFVREIRTDGGFVRDFELPKAFNYVDNSTAGGRSNLLFESLAVTPEGRLFTATEDALIEDGAGAGGTGNVVRVTQLDAATGKAAAQYAYPLSSASSAGGFGLAELLAVSDSEFLAVERAFAAGVGNTIRIVRTRLESDTTDVRGIKSLAGARYKPMAREVLLEMPPVYQGVRMDNIEAISWGPRLRNGNRTLVLVADNNFSDTQATLFLAFEVLPK